MMASDKLRRAFDKLWGASERRNRIQGRLGRLESDGSYTVKVSSRPGFAYVRVGPEGNESVTIAFNAGVPYRANLPVVLRRLDSLGPLTIAGVDSTGGRMESWAGGSGSTYNVGPHTHRIGSGLEYELEALRFEIGRVHYYDGMKVYIKAFRYQKSDATWKTWPGGILDLTSNIPSNAGNWAWVLVGVDPSDNTAIAVTGDEYSYTTPLTPELIDDISYSGYIPCTAIKVKESDTDLNINGRYTDAHGWFFGAESGEDLVKVSSNDTTADYLINKLVGGTSITLTETNDGGDEDVTIDLDSLEASDLSTMWEPLTNGDAATPELVFADGDVIMVEVST